MDKRRLQNNNKCADVPSTRTRQRYASYSDAYEDKTAEHIGSYNSTIFGTGRRTSEHRLHLLRHGHKLDMVEFSTLGKFSSVARVATRRMARPKVVGEMVSEDDRRSMFTLASGN